MLALGIMKRLYGVSRTLGRQPHGSVRLGLGEHGQRVVGDLETQPERSLDGDAVVAEVGGVEDLDLGVSLGS